MVLGLGSRSKKDRAHAVSQLVKLDLHLHEIKPWQGLARPSKTPPLVALRWSRGERLTGSSRSVSPVPGSGAEIGKIVIGETIRIPIAPNREILKRAKKSYPELDNPLVFTLLEVNDLKGKPLAQAVLELSTLASIRDSKLIAVPFSVSKKVAKGPMPYLHLTVQLYIEDKASGLTASASSANSLSSRTSDASSAPPLDEDSQQMLVAALLSDEEDDGNNKQEEIDFFTDDEEALTVSEGSNLADIKAIVEPVPATAKNVDQRPSNLEQRPSNLEPVPATAKNVDQKPSNLAVQPTVEKQQSLSVDDNYSKQAQRFEESLSRHAVTPPQASPVKAAAIAAANAYAKKQTFLSRGNHTYMDESDDPYSDLDSDGEAEFSSGISRALKSPSLPPKGPQTSVLARSHLTTLSMRSADSVSSKTRTVAKDNKAADIMQTDENKSSTNSTLSNIPDTSASGGGMGSAVDGSAEVRASVDVMVTRSVMKAANGSFSEPTSEPEAFLRREASNERNFGGVSSQKLEIAKSNSTGSSVGEAASKHQQARAPVDMKTRPAVKSPLREKSVSAPSKLIISNNPDQMKGRALQSPVQDGKPSKGTNQEGKGRVFKSPDRGIEKGERKAPEESRQRNLHVDAKAVTVETKIQDLESEVEKLKGELRDVAVVEAALYSATAEHGSSSMKLHAPARRLARMYLYAWKNWSQERRASCANNTMSGLILVARACGNDVPRLTFWWSNTTVLREIIATASKNSSPTSSSSIKVMETSFQSDRRNSPNGLRLRQQQRNSSPAFVRENWSEPSTFISSLERLESWIFTKVVESIWWQVLTPHMQQPMKEILSDNEGNGVEMRRDAIKHGKRNAKSELEDASQGNVSVDIWKKAFLDAFERLCPVRRMGVECGCLPMLYKLVLEACVVRLDVSMFNAILRDDEVPTDPISDPISDIRVLPIPNSSLSFGLGAQLKNSVATLCSFLSNLSSKDGENASSAVDLEDDEKNMIMFPLLKAMGGLLMLPKDMLMDKSLRKEVCPTLDLPFIGRILSKFLPDEFSPEPVTPELLETINAEIVAENQNQEDTEDCATVFRIATAPTVRYSPPAASMVKQWIGDSSGTNNRYGRSDSSVLRKGHTSDDEIDELESPLSWLSANTPGFVGGSNGSTGNIKRGGAASSPTDVRSTNRRYTLLREVWNSS